MANKSLGQHFLKSKSAAQTIVRTIQPEQGETIFEIGPGHGELTKPLAEICSARGCALCVIEKDKRLAELLRAQAWMHGVEIIADDALTFLGSERMNAVRRNRPYRVVGNIPYYLTGHLLRTISELVERPVLCVFMLQKEVAERIVAEPPKMNRLAASVQFWAKPKIIGTVAKENFQPVPEVDSAIVSLNTREGSNTLKSATEADRYYAAVRKLFAQPRKTILNNLAAKESSGRKGEIVSALRAIGVAPESRPQNLTVEKITAIAQIPFS